MISAGVEGRLPYMTYPEPWRGPPKQPPEFLRPAPKPLPSANRYNGISSNVPNGTRLGPPQRPISKYPSPPAVSPVNLTQQHKEDIPDELQYSAAYSSLFSHPAHFPYHASPYASLYQTPYSPLLRPNFVQPPPLSPLDTYTPTTPTSSTFLSPPQATFSPPTPLVKPGQSVLRERKIVPQSLPPPPQTSFKVPSGKEGSLKHRILTRPEDALPPRSPLDLQREAQKKKLPPVTTLSPPQSPAKPLNNNLPTKYLKGSLVQLANGELRKVEDMRTEDFVLSAERCPELMLADSTLVKIEENPITGTATITLTYNHRRAQVEVESPLEHPYFVYGKGWASCNADRTLQCYGLKVHRLQVGDVLISLTPRETTQSTTPRSATTIITTATTTAMTVRQVSTSSKENNHHPHHHHHHHHTAKPAVVQQRPPQSLSPDSMARKRRWSAPDHVCDDEGQSPRRIRVD